MKVLSPLPLCSSAPLPLCQPPRKVLLANSFPRLYIPFQQYLLAKPGNRPKILYLGEDVYDSQRVSIISEGAEAKRVGFKYDTTVAANSHQGNLYSADSSSD